MATDLVDFAALETAATAAEASTEDTSAGSGEPEVEDKTGEEPEAGKDTGDKDTEAGKDDLPGSEQTPQEVRKALKAFRDAAPENAAATKLLHNSYERWNAVKEMFPKGVTEIKAAKELIDLVGGAEGYEAQLAVVDSIKASDAKLYAGDASLLDDILEDLKSEGKTESFGKIIGPGFDRLKTVDEKAYYEVLKPHFLDAFKEAKADQVIAGLSEVLSLPDDAKPEDIAAAAKKALSMVGGLNKWIKGLETESQKAKAAKIDPDRLKLDEDRKSLAKEREDFSTNQTKEFQKGVAVESEKGDNQVLGKHLGPFLKMPFFKGYTKENLMPLGNNIKANLHEALKTDKVYQARMKSLWGAKTPDRAEIVKQHRSKVDEISDKIVRDTVQRMYPGYAKGGPAAGRVAAATEKKAAQNTKDAAINATGKPIYVATRPTWEEMDHTKDPKDLLVTTGKAYLKNGKFVTWRK